MIISKLTKTVRNDIIKQFLRKALKNRLFMSKVSKVSKLAKTVRNDMTTHFLRKSIKNFKKRAVYVKSTENIRTFQNGKK